MGEKTCLLVQVLVTFYEAQILIEASFPFISDQNLMGLNVPQSFFEVHKDHPAKQDVG